MWYYTLNGQQLGPVDEGTLDRLMAEGTVNAETLSWKEGLSQWTPLGQVRPFNPALLMEAACATCGKAVGSDNLVDILGLRFCIECKPKAVQAMREGVSPVLHEAVWQDGKKVATLNGAVFPRRCYKCNQSAEGPPLKRKFGKQTTVWLHLCPLHLQRRRYLMIAGWVGVLVSCGVMITDLIMDTGQWLVCDLMVFLTIIFVTRIGAVAQPLRFKGDIVWLGGAGRKFLASLSQPPPHI